MTNQTHTFEEWFAEFRRLMISDYGFPPNKPDSFYGDAESRRDAYDDGETPDEALAYEIECAL